MSQIHHLPSYKQVNENIHRWLLHKDDILHLTFHQVKAVDRNERQVKLDLNHVPLIIVEDYEEKVESLWKWFTWGVRCTVEKEVVLMNHFKKCFCWTYNLDNLDINSSNCYVTAHLRLTGFHYDLRKGNYVETIFHLDKVEAYNPETSMIVRPPRIIASGKRMRPLDEEESDSNNDEEEEQEEESSQPAQQIEDNVEEEEEGSDDSLVVIVKEERQAAAVLSSASYIWRKSEDEQQNYYRCRHGWVCPTCEKHVTSWQAFKVLHRHAGDFKGKKIDVCKKCV